MLKLYLENDFLIQQAVFWGSYLVVSQAEKRRHWRLRLLLAELVLALWMFSYYLQAQTDAWTFADVPLPFSALRYIVLFVLNALLVMSYCKVGFFPALLAGTVGYSLQHMCERGWEIPRHLLSLPVWQDRLCLALVFLAALWIYWRLGIRGGRAQERFSSYEQLNNRLLLCLAVVVIIACVIMDLLLSARMENPMGRTVFLYSRCASALISFLVLLVCNCHMRETESTRRAQIADQILHSEREKYEQEKEIHDAILIRCHDIRHQIRALGREGYREELGEIGKLVTIYDAGIRSENSALDVVLANKCLAFAKREITFSCIADGKLLSFMSDKDVYALFGNILDNAYEAVSRIEDPQWRQISLSVRRRAGFVLIEEENYYEGSLSYEEGLPVTDKKDSLYHGYGMRSIRMLTEKYGGDFQVESEGRIFRLSLMIPLSREEEEEE